jgi:lambda family phage portal protein
MRELVEGKPHLVGPAAVASPLSVKAEAYTGASWTSSDLRNWAPPQGSADSDFLPERGTLIRRSRDLARNHGVAAGAQQTILDNVLGCGLWLAPTPNYAALGKDVEWAREWSKKTKAKWRLWSETTACDAGESLTLDGQATQIFGGAWVNGEGLALPLWLPRPSHSTATRLQVVEADRLSNPNFSPNTAALREGVEIDIYGAPQAYHIRNAHPGDRFWFLNNQLATWSRIPAKTAWGRRRVIHVHDKGRAGQSHGIPALANVMSQFKVLGDYQRYELKACAVNAMIALITESAVGQEGLVELLSSNPAALDKYMEGLSQRGRSAINGADGMILPLMLGEKVASFAPARPSTSYEPFTTTVFRHIATGLHIPYELLMKDFSKTNYSSARAALLEAWRFFTGKRNWLGLNFYQPAYELWLEEQVSAGEIDAPGFYENWDAYCCARWVGPGRGWVDPYKEAQAADMRMDIGVSTLQDECAEQGKDWEEVLEQRAYEQKRAKELGVELRSKLGNQQQQTPAQSVDDTGSASGDKRADETVPAAAA